MLEPNSQKACREYPAELLQGSLTASPRHIVRSSERSGICGPDKSHIKKGNRVLPLACKRRRAAVTDTCTWQCTGHSVVALRLRAESTDYSVCYVVGPASMTQRVLLHFPRCGMLPSKSGIKLLVLTTTPIGHLRLVFVGFIAYPFAYVMAML